jgi:hypothetical protein
MILSLTEFELRIIRIAVYRDCLLWQSNYFKTGGKGAYLKYTERLELLEKLEDEK